MADARKAAATALKAVICDGKYSNLTFGDVANRFSLSGLDRSFAASLFYGTLDRVITIDAIINLFAKKGISGVPPYSAAVLRSAVYQLMYLDRVPDSAAVNEAVRLVKSSREKYCSGFVNAVLRSIIRNRHKVVEFLEESGLSVRYSCPEEIVSSLISDYGIEDAAAFLESTLVAPKTYLRVNPLKATAEQLAEKLKAAGVEAVIVSKDCIALESGFNIEADTCYAMGLYHAEGRSSQFAAEAAAPPAGGRMLDVCAAPGGKSFTVAQLMGNSGEVVSADLHPHRVQLIDAGARRLGLDIVRAIVHDATVFDKSLGLFDSVLCDVPCSGFGVIGRKPDIKLRMFDKDLPALQLKILDTASLYVKPGGKLVYSTCTLRRAENDDVIAEFCRNHPEFSRDNDLFSDKTFFPHRDNTDGFFISVLRKM